MIAALMREFNSLEPVFRLVGLCIGIFLMGRATLEALLSGLRVPTLKQPIIRNPNYIALALGPTTLLLLTWLLRVLGAYSYYHILIAVFLYIIVVALSNRNFRNVVLKPYVQVDAIGIAYLLTIVVIWIILPVSEYPLRRTTSVYLLQGFNIFDGKHVALVPHYGTTITLPFLYVGHLISAAAGLFSHGSHDWYYAYGQYWLNLLIAPAIPFGAYLFFKRNFGKLAAMIAALLFCSLTVDVKIWSLRGESLAWIFGFAFLIALFDIVTSAKNPALSKSAGKLFPVLSLLFFGVSLTHAGTASIAGIIAFAFGCVALTEFWRRSDLQILTLFKLAVYSLSFLVLLYSLFATTYAGNPDPMESARRPPAGQRDAAIQYDNAWYNWPLYKSAPLTKASPPYISPLKVAGITAILPVASLVHPGIADFSTREFPSLAIHNLHKLPFGEVALLLALLPLIASMYLSGFAEKIGARHQKTFWTVTACYIIIVMMAIYFDYRSVSLYPLAAIRRSFVYETFFYCMAMFCAVLDFFFLPLGRVYMDATTATWDRATKWYSARLVRPIFGVVVLFLVPMWFINSINSVIGKPSSPQAVLRSLILRVDSKFGNGPEVSKDGPFNPVRLNPIFSAMDFLRRHTKVDDFVFTNVISSDNAFWFLSDGRYSTLEGAAVYQLYFAQEKAAERMHEFAHFLETGDASHLPIYDSQYALFYKGPTCHPIMCYGDRVVPTKMNYFRNSPFYHVVYENRYYVIFKMNLRGAKLAPPDEALAGRPPISDRSEEGRGNNLGVRSSEAAGRFYSCLHGDGTPGVVIKICTTDLGSTNLPRKVVASLLGARAAAYTKAGLIEAALDDLNEARSFQPEDSDLAYRVGNIYFAMGKYNEAIRAYSQTIALNSDYGSAYYRRGLAYEMVLKPDRAISDFRAAININPNIRGSFVQLKKLLEKRKINAGTP